MQYINAGIYTERGYVPGAFTVKDGLFTEVMVGPSAGMKETGDVVDLRGRKVLPGLIDIHIHGAAGSDFSDGNIISIENMAAYLAKAGVTSFVPTSMTLPHNALAAAFRAARDYNAFSRDPEHRGLSKLAGIHMEGPFLSEKKCGAQNRRFLRSPDMEEFRELYELSGGLIRIADIAPELEGAAEFTREAADFSTISIAHTDADYDEASRIFDAGATHLTHLFNAMPSIHHRAPGVIGAASERNDVIAELICDGHHVHPSAVRMAFKLFPGRICLVSDALRCLGMPDGDYDLGGQTVALSDGVAKLADGTLAGSSTGLFDCMKNAIRFGIPEIEAVRAAATVPAGCIGMTDRIGSIAAGKAADFLICDDDLNLEQVFIDGVRAA